MKYYGFITFLVVWAAYSAIDSTSAQSILEKCVNRTLVLGEACQATPRVNSFKAFKSSLANDMALIVLTLAIPDQHSLYEHRFDLVKTDVGQFLLTLKSQMEFLTIDLPLLSNKVDRQYMELVPYPPGCVTNITVNVTLVQSWLLCVLTNTIDGVETLSVKKLCIQTYYKEPNPWFLFKDTYEDICTDTPLADSAWVKLEDNAKAKRIRWILNYAVSILTTFIVAVIGVYRHVRHTKDRVFLYKLRQSEEHVCKAVAQDESDVTLSPYHLNLSTLEACYKCIKQCCTESECRGDNGEENNTKSQHERREDTVKDCHHKLWETIVKDKNNTYKLNVTGFWFVIGKNELISYNSFYLSDFAQIYFEALLAKVWDLCRKCCCCCKCIDDGSSDSRKCCSRYTLGQGLIILFSIGLIVVTCVTVKNDPFLTLLDVICCLVLPVLLYGFIRFIDCCCLRKSECCQRICKSKCCQSMCKSKCCNWFCVVRSQCCAITKNVLFYWFAFLIVVILIRVVLILVIALAVQSGSNIYILGSIASLFILINGYNQLKETHIRYVTFFEMCMKKMIELVHESETLNEPVFKKRVVFQNKVTKPAVTNDKGLFLELNTFALFYLSNGESAIHRDCFTYFCKNDSNHSPGDLGCTAMWDVVKFFITSLVIIGFIYVQFYIADNFDSSIYKQTPYSVFGGLILFFLKFFFGVAEKKLENDNLHRLLQDTQSKFKKRYHIINFETEDKPVCVPVDEENQVNVWEIHIEANKKEKCYCPLIQAQGQTNEQSTGGNEDDVVLIEDNGSTNQSTIMSVEDSPKESEKEIAKSGVENEQTTERKKNESVESERKTRMSKPVQKPTKSVDAQSEELTPLV